MLDPEAEPAQDVLRRFVVDELGFIQEGLQGPAVLLLQPADGRHQGAGGQGIQVIAFDEPLSHIRPGDHLDIGAVRQGHDFPAVALDEVNQALVEDVVVARIQVPENGDLRP